MTQKLEEPNKVQVTITIDKKLVEVVDELRGNKMSRSAWVNDAIRYTLTADNVPYTKDELKVMQEDYMKNIHKINNARKGKYPHKEAHHEA